MKYIEYEYDIPLDDELEAIKTAFASPNDYISDNEVDWDNLEKHL
jgi:hypothetical protein